MERENRENKENKVPSISGFFQVTKQCSKFWKRTTILRLVWLTSTGSNHSEDLHPPQWCLSRKQVWKSKQKFTTNVSCYMPDCTTVFSYKTHGPNAEKIRVKISQIFKCCGKLHTLNSGATCALFRDSSKLKQKSTSASASLSTKFCSSEKDRLMMWHTKHKHGPGWNLSRTSWWQSGSEWQTPTRI